MIIKYYYGKYPTPLEFFLQLKTATVVSLDLLSSESYLFTPISYNCYLYLLK